MARSGNTAGLSAAGLMIADEMQDDAYQFKTLEYNASKAALAGNPEEAARLMTQVENGQFKSEAMETPEYWKRKNVLENAPRYSSTANFMFFAKNFQVPPNDNASAVSFKEKSVFV